MRNKAPAIIMCMLLLLVFSTGFTDRSGYRIVLRFTKNYPDETIEKQKTGLLWALSYLGAELPKGSFEKALVAHDSVFYELDLEAAGFNSTALAAFKTIVAALKESEEYRKKKGIDLGEFIVYTLGSSWHYYTITGAAATLADYQQRYNYSSTVKFPVLKSDVAFHNRMLELVQTDSVPAMSFMASDGEGSIEDRSFNGETYEVFDIMPNGQLRFAVYDKNGRLSDASEAKFGHAGKPIKCLWCHEIVIQPLFSANKAVDGYMTPAFFNELVAQKMKALNRYRTSLTTDVRFENLQDHTLMELLYISYMQPSVYKLRQEWGIPEKKLRKKLAGQKLHDHYEFPFLKDLYERGVIKKWSPYKTVALPDSIREPNAHEPNLFK